MAIFCDYECVNKPERRQSNDSDRKFVHYESNARGNRTRVQMQRNDKVLPEGQTEDRFDCRAIRFPNKDRYRPQTKACVCIAEFLLLFISRPSVLGIMYEASPRRHAE